MDVWLLGLEAALQPMSLLMLVVGVLGGIVIGALPGLTAVMGVAILMPFTFAMDPLPGMMMMCGIYTSSIYAGSIPAILMRVPGTPSSAAALLDGYPMAKQGKAGEALTISLLSSLFGALTGGILLALAAPVLAAIAVKVSQADYFMIALFALTIIASISETQLAKGLMSGVFGLLVATVGTDPLTGAARLTFGVPELRSGLDFIPVLIGLFGIAEAINQFSKRFRADADAKHDAGRYTLSRGTFKKILPTMLLSSPIGFLIGVLPGTGGEVASFVAYNESRRIAKDKDSFGTGNPKGLAAAETAHNAAVPGTLAPTLTLGIPGNSVAALMIGVLTVHGLHVGPALFDGEPALTYGILWGFVLVPLVVLLVGLLGIRAWGNVLRIPPQILWPGVVAICCMGAFSIRSSVFDVAVMLIFGIIGYLFDRMKVPTTPMVIGLLVGSLAENGFRRATILEGGSYAWILQPLPLVLLILSLVSLAITFWRSAKRRRSTRTASVSVVDRPSDEVIA